MPASIAIAWAEYEAENRSFQKLHLLIDTYETVLKYIRTTRTQSGLVVRAVLLPKKYEVGIKVSDEQMRGLRMTGARVLPRWNYTIRPHEN